MYSSDSNSEASRRYPQDHQYGRRVEADSSWTVYHVFTGVPADAGCGVMTGLSRTDATNTMMSLNRHSARLRMMRAWVTPLTMDAAL